jgi:hypothetical protein
MTPQRIILLLGGIAAAVALFLLVRPGDEDQATTVPATTAPATTTRAATTEETTTTEPEPAGPTSFRVTARGGRPVGGVQKLEARKGERIRIVVRADVADHVHLHGYDLMLDVAPGAPAQLVFTADLTGVFELELEDRKLLLAEVEVRP